MQNSALEKAATRKVKSEVDLIIDDVRSNLQSYVDGESGTSSLQVIKKSLTQIERTLQLLQINGAVVLARELGDVVDELIAESIPQKDKAQETISRGIIQLSDYIEYIELGHKDVPAVLLPLLNDLRGVREAPLLSEHILFFPNFDEIEVPNVEAKFGMQPQEVAKMIRYGYQIGLVSLIQNKEIHDSATKICKVAIRLHQCSKVLAARRLWWITSGVAQAIAIGSLQTSTGLASLLGQVDRQIKKFIYLDEEEFGNSIPQSLIKNLLYYVGIADVRGRIVNKIKFSYGLKDLIPDDIALNEMRENMSGPNIDVLDAVSKALIEDIAGIKDIVELYAHSENSPPDDVSQVSQSLQKIADTLSILGLEEPREKIMSHVSIIKELTFEDLDQANSYFVNIAETLILVEGTVENYVKNRSSSKSKIKLFDNNNEEKVEEGIDKNQIRKIQSQAILEILAELEDAKDVISQLLSAPEDVSKAEEVQSCFRKIIGALLMLNYKDAAIILEHINTYLIEYTAKELNSQSDKLEAFADSITSVECYLEAILSEEIDIRNIIHHGIESISKLIGSKVAFSNENNSLRTIEIKELIDDSHETQSKIQEEANLEKKTLNLNENIGLEELSATTIGLKLDKDVLAELIEGELDETRKSGKAEVEKETLKQSNELPLISGDKTENDLSPNNSPENKSKITSTHESLQPETLGMANEDSEVDIELNNQEEGALLELSDDNSVNENDSDLISLNFSESNTKSNVESDLTKSIEEANLSACISEDAEHDIDQPSNNEVLLGSDKAESIHSIIINENGVGKELKVLKEVADEEVFKIFLEEAEEEIGKISNNLLDWQKDLKNENALITARRSFHTLKGSGRFIGAEIIGEVAWHFENLLNKVIDKYIDINSELHDLLKQSIEVLPELLEQLKGGANPKTDIQKLVFSVKQFCNKEDSIDNNTERHAGITTGTDVLDDTFVTKKYASTEYSRQIKENEDNIIEADNEKYERVSEDNSDENDKELRAIFINESKQYLQTLTEALNINHIEEKLEVTENFSYALHTLNGAARTARIEAIFEICGLLEKFCSKCFENNCPICGVQNKVLSDSVAYFSYVVSELEESAKLIDLDEELLDRVKELKCVGIPVLEEIVLSPKDAPRNSNHQESEQDINQVESEPVTPKDKGKLAVNGIENADIYQDKDEDLTEIFLEEASDILSICNECLEEWNKSKHNENAVSEFRRQLHTLKGSARMAAYANIGDFSHAIESLVISVAEGLIKPSGDVFILLQRCLDSLHEMIEDAISHRPVFSASKLIAEIQNIKGEGGSIGDSHEVSDQAFSQPEKLIKDEDDSEESKPRVKIPVLEAIIDQESQKKPQPIISPQQGVRLQADLLDNLVNNAGEVNIFQARLEQASSKYISSINELEQIVDRLREQLRNLEIETETQILSSHAHENPNLDDFDPLELDRYSNIQQLSRSLAESVNDLFSVKEILFDQVRESEMLLLQQNRISNDLQEGLMRARMVQFNQLVPRMQRIVRQTATELDKSANLKVYGSDTEVDSSILNRVVAPLEHLIRNAVAHGIESREQRLQKEKSKQGEISISVIREGSEIVIEVSDDGAGIDPEKIKCKALDLGLIENIDISERELLNLIMTPGFSTAGQVTQVSGRGVGMDVVANELKQLGGYLQIDSLPGKGATFTVRIPFTLAIAQALLVKCGDEVYAVPLSSVEGVVRLSAHELKQKYENQNASYRYADKDYRLCHLGKLLDICRPQMNGADLLFPLLLVRSGESRLAIHVEATLGNREIVVKPLASQLSRLPAVSGATILGDGSVVLILDIQGLIRLDSIEKMENSGNESVIKSNTSTILVVDDSITIRKVTTRFLERNNYSVVTAKDGVDAVRQLQDFTPDAILLDIEMPRMDGYELASHVRNNARLKNVPIIMITSRTGDKHRQRALEIGVQHYLGKPYNESELLQYIDAVIQ